MKLPSVLAISLASVVALSGCHSEPKPKAITPEVVRNVAVARAQTVQLPDVLPALGTVRAAQTAQLSSQIMGTISAIQVHEGDLVKQGQVLILIDPAQAQAGLERALAAQSGAQHDLTAARTDRDLAESTLKRYATLYERKSVSPQEFDEVRARQSAAASRADAAQDAVAQAKAAVSQAQASFNYTRLRAPFDGVITARLADPGAMASPGVPLLTLESSGLYRAELTVDESNLHLVKLGAAVPISLDADPDEHISGKVVQILPAADPLSRTFLVKIELPHSPTLRSGLSATGNFSRGSRDAVVLPITAVIDRGALKAIYVVDGDHLASLRYVTIGAGEHDQIEILSGVAENETVIASPQDREFGGKKIEVQ